MTSKTTTPSTPRITSEEEGVIVIMSDESIMSTRYPILRLGNVVVPPLTTQTRFVLQGGSDISLDNKDDDEWMANNDEDDTDEEWEEDW